MQHAMVKDETGTPFCLCGFQPHTAALWEAKHDTLAHVAEMRNPIMPKLAGKVTIDLQHKRLFIDGDEFPWHISEDGVDAQELGSRNTLPSIVIRVPAETIEVIPKDGDG